MDILEDLAIFPDAHNAGEAFFQGGRFEMGGHLLHYVFGNLTKPILIALETNLKGHIEEQRLD